MNLKALAISTTRDSSWSVKAVLVTFAPLSY